jgi:hypothetical protein
LEGVRPPCFVNARSDKWAPFGIFEPKQLFGDVRTANRAPGSDTTPTYSAHVATLRLPPAISIAIPPTENAGVGAPAFPIRKGIYCATDKYNGPSERASPAF